MTPGTASARTATDPLFTVIALCFNHQRFLLECLDSIEAQTCRDFELIVTDDASTDDSAMAIEQLLIQKRPDARFVRHTRNRGVCATVNEAVALARGRFIAMIATDDRWHPQRLARHAQWLDTADTRTAVVYSDACVIDEAGVEIGDSFIQRHRPGHVARSGELFGDLVDANFVPAMCASVLRSAIAAVGGYDERLTFEDWDMWLRLADAGWRFEYLPGPLADYRIVSTSISRTTFARPSANQYFTMYLIWRKLLASSRLQGARRQLALARLAGDAYRLLLTDDPRGGAAIVFSGWKNRNIRAVGVGAVRCLGLRRSTMKRWASQLGFGTA